MCADYWEQTDVALPPPPRQRPLSPFHAFDEVFSLQMEVLQESKNMVPDCQRRLESAHGELVTFLVSLTSQWSAHPRNGGSNVMSLQCPHFISSCHSPFKAMIEPNRVNRKVIFSVTVGQGGKYCNSNDLVVEHLNLV